MVQRISYTFDVLLSRIYLIKLLKCRQFAEPLCTYVCSKVDSCFCKAVYVSGTLKGPILQYFKKTTWITYTKKREEGTGKKSVKLQVEPLDA